MKTRTLLFTFIIIFFSVSLFAQNNNITITDNASHNADASAVLDVYSTSKGMLVPRMTTNQILLISNPATGLLVFNTDNNSFYFYNGAIWQNLSDPSGGIWGVNSSTGDVYVTDLLTNIGIGTDEPVSKLAVVANSGANPDDPLFVVQDEFGEPIFAVTSDGVRVYVKDGTKGIGTKGISGGFAVGKYGAAKTGEEYLRVTPDSTRVYTQYSGKAVSGGFAVGKYGSAKGVDNFLKLNDENYLMGHRSGKNITSGLYNLFLGYETGIADTSGSKNILIGHKAGYSNLSGDDNIFVGLISGYNNTVGRNNIFMGNASGFNNSDGSYNVYIGDSAGFNNETGWYNVAVGYYAGHTSTNVNNSTFLGAGAGMLAQGSDNTLIGNSSGAFVTQGEGNTCVGLLAGLKIHNGNNNVYIGRNSAFNGGGSNNTFVGESTGYTGGGSNNVFLGYGAGYFETASDRLYIDNAGNDAANTLIYGEFDNKILALNADVGIGKINPTDAALDVAAAKLGWAAKFDNDGNNVSRYGILIQAGTDDASGTNYLIDFKDGDGTYLGYITATDSHLELISNVKNYKINLQESKINGQEIINNLRVVSFDNNVLNSQNIGFDYKQAITIFPEMVSKDERTGNFGMANTKLIPVLTKAIQEQNAEIEILKNDNEKLKLEMIELRKLIEQK